MKFREQGWKCPSCLNPVECTMYLWFCIPSIGQTVVLKPENFALICGLCLEQLSDKTRIRPLGTCQNKGHFKVCTAMHV